MFIYDDKYGSSASVSLTDDATEAELIASVGVGASFTTATVRMDAAALRGLATEALAMADEIDTATIAAEVAAAETTEAAAELADPDRYCRTCGLYHSAAEAAAAAQLGRCPRWAPEDAPGATPEAYTMIARWGRWMMSSPWYIADQQRKAHADRAPVDAIYHVTPPAGDGWVTARDVTNPAARDYLNAEAVR
jgi:hypothetical protein